MPVKTRANPFEPTNDPRRRAQQIATHRRREAKKRSVSSGRYSLSLPLPPSTNDLYAPTLAKSPSGKTIAVISQTEKAKLYKKLAKYKVQKELGLIPLPLAGPLFLQIVIYRPRRAGDLDNYLKILKDSMNAVLWVDDSQVEEEHLKFGKVDKLNPRVEIMVCTMDLRNAPEQTEASPL